MGRQPVDGVCPDPKFSPPLSLQGVTALDRMAFFGLMGVAQPTRALASSALV